MASLSKTLMRTSGLVALCVLGCTVGCGGNDASGLGTDDDTGVADDAGGDSSVRDTSTADSAKDSAVDSGTDSGADAGKDSGVDSGKDSAADTADSGGTDSADSGVDTGIVDTGALDTGVLDTTVTDTTVDAADTLDTAPVCTVGTLCADGSVCTAGTGGAGPSCTPCATDGDCSVAPGTLCFAGKCEVATCHPKSGGTAATGCTTGTCCATTSPATAGTCFAAASGTTCCDDTDCTGLTGTTSCDVASHTCVCPAPAAGAYFVGSQGSDTTGNGSSSCPFQTVTKALTTAVATPTVATTVTLLDDSGTTPTRYGSGCSAGGALCDATPIIVAATFTGGVTVQGAAAAADVVITGGATGAEVLIAQAASVSFKHLTVIPTATAGAAIPQGGIDYAGPAAGSAAAEGAVTDVVVTGTANTGAAVFVHGGASPTIGPAFVSTGGSHGVFVSNSGTTAATGSAPTITSAAGAQTKISRTKFACIRVDTVAASTGGTPTATVSSSDAATPVSLVDCGGLGGIVVDTATANLVTIGDVAVTMTTGGAGASGIHLLNAGAATVANTTITGLSGTGIVAEGTSSLTITAAVSSSNNRRGAYLTGSSVANITGLTASASTGSAAESDGLRCDVNANVILRGSTFLSNTSNGVFVTGNCIADLGSAATAGNVFNKTSTANGLAGLCFNSSAGTVTAGGATWSCNYSGVGCTGTLSPTRGTPPGGTFNCRAGKDIDAASGTTVNSPSPQCCN